MFPTGLSMLWESTEPRGALRQRFGLNDFDDAVAWLTKVLGQAWAIDVDVCDRIVISDNNAIAWVRTDQGPLVAKWSRAQDQFARLTAVADLLQALHQQGARVAPPLASIDGRRRVTISSGAVPLSMMVQPELAGDLLDITDETSVRRAGACLADLHNALAGLPDRRLIDARPMSLDLRRRIEGTASARLREQIASLPPIDREPQLIHGDFRASNVLTAGSEILAVIDFDGVSWDHCISDLANVYFGTHFVDWQPTPPSVRDTLLEGYQSVRPLSRLEHRWFQALVRWQAIHAGWADAL